VSDERFTRLERLALERADRPHWHPGTDRRARRSPWPAIVALAFLLGLLAGVQLRACALDAPPPIVSILVRPQIMLQRGDIRVEVRVPRHRDNRRLLIAWTSDVGTEGSTIRPLEGEDAAVLHVLALPSQPAANYTFVAAVFNSLGKLRGRADGRIVVPDDRAPYLVLPPQGDIR